MVVVPVGSGGISGAKHIRRCRPAAGVFGNDAMETGIPVEVWRYYLLAVRPEVSDSGEVPRWGSHSQPRQPQPGSQALWGGAGWILLLRPKRG